MKRDRDDRAVPVGSLTCHTPKIRFRRYVVDAKYAPVSGPDLQLPGEEKVVFPRDFEPNCASHDWLSVPYESSDNRGSSAHPQRLWYLSIQADRARLRLLFRRLPSRWKRQFKLPWREAIALDAENTHLFASSKV